MKYWIGTYKQYKYKESITVGAIVGYKYITKILYKPNKRGGQTKYNCNNNRLN